MHLLNLDDLQVVTRQVSIKGETYSITEQTVGGMIEAIRLTQTSIANDGAGAEKVFESMVRLAKSLIPDAPESVISGMTFKQLSALLEFANASDKEAVEGAIHEGESTAGAEDSEKK